MRHQVAGRKLGRKSAHRAAMFRNMASSLIEHGRIRTTIEKAKELRGIADKLVTIGKQNSLQARRHAFDLIRNRDAVQRLFAVIAPAFSGRNGGYTRIYRLENRPGDAAQMAYIEYLAEDVAKVAAKVEAKTEKKAEAKKPAKEKAPKVKKEAAPKAAKEPKAPKAEKAEKPKAKKAAAKKEK